MQPRHHTLQTYYDLITSPAHIVVSARDRFKNPTKRVNELWQTDFTNFKVIGWGWFYLASILDDFSRYIIAWKLFDRSLRVILPPSAAKLASMRS